jgi:hypothetical protein
MYYLKTAAIKVAYQDISTYLIFAFNAAKTAAPALAKAKPNANHASKIINLLTTNNVAAWTNPFYRTLSALINAIRTITNKIQIVFVFIKIFNFSLRLNLSHLFELHKSILFNLQLV